MALVTVAITGHVLAPDGSAPTSGRLVVKLSQAGSALDGSESVRVATEVTEDLGAGGAVSFALAPNDTITPSGTYYLATFVAQLASGRRVQWAEKWQLTSADLTLDIGAVPRIDAAPGVALQQDTAWPEAAAASVAAAAASEAAAAQSQSAAASSATAAALARASFQSPPAQAKGVTQARSACLRAVLLNRRRDTSGIDQWWPGGYTGWYIRDTLYMAMVYPGLFTATELRRVIDYWATSYRTPQADFAFQVLNGTWAYSLSGVYPVFDTPAIMALLVSLCVERGDTTVWSTHGAKVTAALAVPPRGDNGLIYSSPALPAVGFGFHDRLEFTGEMAAVSAQTAYAYQRLATLVDSTFQADADVLVQGLASKRRSDGYYNAADNESTPDLIATALVGAYGLCSADELLVTGNRLADDYRAGLISQRGAVRFLPSPWYWTHQRSPPAAENYFQNGGYSMGPWSWWTAKAMMQAGRGADAATLLQEAVTEILQQQRKTITGEAPYEWFYGGTGAGYPFYGAASGVLETVAETDPEDIVTEIPGTASSVKLLHVPFHAISAMELRAAASSTATVTVTAGSRLHGLADPFGYADNAEVTIGALGVQSASYGVAKMGMKPAYPYGGWLRFTLSAGSSAQPLGLKLFQRKPSPLLLQPSSAVWTDNFTTDILSSYLRPNPTNWNIVGGQLNNVSGVNYDAILAPTPTADLDIEANVTSTSASNVLPGLCCRWQDPNNFISVRISSTVAVVFEMKAGVFTTLGTISSPATNNVPIYVKMSLRGTTLNVTVGATTNGFTATITAPGLAGPLYSTTVPGFPNTAQWDALVVTPVATTQRDWNSDGAALYTRTGTWSVASTRLLSTDAVSPVAALHPDFTATQSNGVTATFKSANWAARPAGLCVRAVTASNCIYAVCNGPEVRVYDRNTTDTLIGTATLATPAADGVDITMTLRVKRFTVLLRVGTQYWYFPTTRPLANGTCGAFATGANSNEVSYASMRIDSYDANVAQPVPVGFVLDGGPLNQAWATEDVYAGNMSAQLVLRDGYGNAVQTLTNADDARIYY